MIFQETIEQIDQIGSYIDKKTQTKNKQLAKYLQTIVLIPWHTN